MDTTSPCYHGTCSMSILNFAVYGITTPIVTILIVVFAWSGALLTLYKFKKSIDVRTEVEAKKVAEAVRDVK